MIKNLAVCGLIAIGNIAWASETVISTKADHPVAISKTAEAVSASNGTVTRSSTITGGTKSSGMKSAVIQDLLGTILVIGGQSGVTEIRYGTTKKALEKIAKAKALPLKKLSDSEWVMGVNGAHIMFKNGKVAGEKLNLAF